MLQDSIVRFRFVGPRRLAVAAFASLLSAAGPALAADVAGAFALRSVPSSSYGASYGVGGYAENAAGADAGELRGGTRRDPFSLDLSAATWVPLSIGPELSVELPGRVLAQLHVGWMPELYSQTLTDSLEGAGVYDAEVSALVDGALQSATTWRFAVGWRPFADHGLELGVGYVHVALDGATRTRELLPLVPPDVAERLDAELGDVGINLDSSIHHFTLAAGWRWLVADRIVIRASVGYMQAFASSSTLDIESFPELTSLSAPTVDAVLHDHYMRYIKTPVVGLGVGYRFF